MLSGHDSVSPSAMLFNPYSLTADVSCRSTNAIPYTGGMDEDAKCEENCSFAENCADSDVSRALSFQSATNSSTEADQQMPSTL